MEMYYLNQTLFRKGVEAFKAMTLFCAPCDENEDELDSNYTVFDLSPSAERVVQGEVYKLLVKLSEMDKLPMFNHSFEELCHGAAGIFAGSGVSIGDNKVHDFEYEELKELAQWYRDLRGVHNPTLYSGDDGKLHFDLSDKKFEVTIKFLDTDGKEFILQEVTEEETGAAAEHSVASTHWSVFRNMQVVSSESKPV